VLNVFGFTSEQTVSDLTGRILRGETPEGIDLLHQQSEAGKDMMRLMADLIAYLRDLLVFKAKPDALNEDVDPDVQKSLAEHAELISIDRLLELIDQFAAAESRMKWVPNKKLYFEVAIIKGIQSLGQVTLDEVIEKLGELRDGGGARPSAVSEAPAAKPIALPKQPASVASGASPAPGSRAVTSAATPQAPVTDKMPTPDPEIDSEKIWQAVIAKIPIQKAFVRNSACAAHVLGLEGRNFTLGFAPAEKAMMDILGTQANRKFVETLLREASGNDWTLKLTINEELASKTPLAAEEAPSHDFNNEPLIQEAIELFNARVRS
jgi:DNA polymerase-3 subunit gamma/tau